MSIAFFLMEKNFDYLQDDGKPSEAVSSLRLYTVCCEVFIHIISLTPKLQFQKAVTVFCI